MERETNARVHAWKGRPAYVMHVPLILYATYVPQVFHAMCIFHAMHVSHMSMHETCFN